jgi:ATP-dependent RNA helicase DDX55/SPB4
MVKLGDEEGVQGLVVLPSRELAIQVNQVANQLSKSLNNIKANSLILIGGYPIEKDLKKFEEEGARLLIGTPGRLYEFIEKSKVSLSDIEILIMDEGDKLLELADSAKLLKILDLLPSTKTMGVFSATITQNLEKLLSVNLSNAFQVTVPVFKGDLSDSSTILASVNEYEAPVQVSPLTKQSFSELSKKTCEVPQSIANSYAVMSSYMQKLDVIQWFIKEHSDSKCIVFLSTCACVEYYYYLFTELFPELKKGVFDRLHRKMSQKKRDKVYSTFLAASSGILLCTDILARGIDIPDVQWIIQYDPPQHSDSFLHRVGRTARAGKKGMVSLLR